MIKSEAITLSELIARATANGTARRDQMMKASMAYHLCSDPFWIWAHHHAPKDQAVDEENEHDWRRMQRGLDFESRWVTEHYPDALTITPPWGHEALVNTLRAMREGVRVLYQPHLSLAGSGVYGKSDLLVRMDGVPSDLGSYSYSPIEVKCTRELKQYHALQGALYHHMVSALQGRTPEVFTVALPGGEIYLRYDQHEHSMRAALARWRELRDGTVRPDPLGIDQTGSPWRVFGNSVLIESQDLTLLAGVGPSTREKIRESLGVRSMADLRECSPGELVGALGTTLGRSVYYNLMAYRLKQPLVVPGTRVVVPRGARAAYALDFETSDDLAPAVGQPPHCYLSGLIDLATGQFVRFLARGPGEEAQMLTQMLDHVGNLDGVVIQTWTEYEVGVLRDAARRHPSLADRLMAFAGACVDLKEALKKQVYLPVPTWSIKCVGPALGFKWRHEGFDAFDSMVSYWKWLETADERLMALPLDYHEDDVRAMAHIVQALEGLAG